MQHKSRVLRALAFVCASALSAPLAAPAQAPAVSVPTWVEPAATLESPGQVQAANPQGATLTGTVLDPSGAAIAHAELHLHSDTLDRTATSDNAGHYTLAAPPASYTLTVDASGFRTYTRSAVVVASARNTALNITLQIATDTTEVNVSSEPGLSTDSDANRTALVFKSEQLETLSDDPSIMQQQLLALAGTDPSSPPQLLIDGFSGGTMPPKETIREIRINQNPFSAQYDQFGSSRIEIFTKPGTNKLHGGFDSYIGNSALNARSPFLLAGAQPSYNTGFYRANINGPLGKKSSFFLNGNVFEGQNNAIVNAIVLDSNLQPVAFAQAVPNPSINKTFSGRFDRQFSANDTFIARYIWNSSKQTNGGVGDLTLASEGSLSLSHAQTLQLTDTHVFSPRVVLDAGFQYIRTHLRQDASSTAPTIIVQGSFNGGGNPSQSTHDNQDRIEFKADFSISHGTHFIRTGTRYRMLREANLNTSGYNGQYVFSSIAAYIAGTPSQFSLTTGTPTATVLSGDIGVYGEDEWKVTPTFSLIYGLRLESQSAVPTRLDVAPRLGFAWSVTPNKKAKQPIAVIRGGAGYFYSRFPANNILQSIRQNGISQQSYFDSNSPTYPNFPTLSQLSAIPPTVYRVNPDLHSPTQIQTNLSGEHSFGKYGNIAANFYLRRSLHVFESLNINAPLPGTYNPVVPTSGIRPFGGTQNIYEFSSDGVSNGHTFAVNANINVSPKLNFFIFAAASHQEANTSGGFASNSYHLGDDAGRVSGFPPRQLFTGLNAQPGWDTSINLFLAARAGTPFNITTGTDLNGDSIYNDRPAFATDLSRPSVVRTAYGNFDTSPLPGQTIIPVNYGTGPSLVYMNMSFAKAFRFGPRPADAAPATPPPAAGKPPAAPGKPAPLPPQRYRIQLGVNVDNPFNIVNRGQPVGILTSSIFGKATSLNSSFSNNSAANRAINFSTRFSF